MYGSEMKHDNTVIKLQEDLETLQFRIYQLTGVKSAVEPVSISSSSVSGVKKVSEEQNVIDLESIDRLSLLERILSKTNELDKEVLKRTTSSGLPKRARRKSISTNLFCLPSHLLIVDRLLDLYKQSLGASSSQSLSSVPSAPIESPQESLLSVLSASDLFATSFRAPKLTPLSSSSDIMLLEEKHKNATLRAELDDSVEQLSTTTHLLFTAQVAAQDCKNDVISLQGAMTRTNSLNMRLKEAIKQQSMSALPEIAEKSDEDLQVVKDQLLSMEKININLQQRLDIEVAANQNICTALMAAAINLNNNETSLLVGSCTLVGNSRLALELLSAALITYDEKKTSKIEKLESSLSAITAQLEEKVSCHISLQKEFDELLKQHDNIKKNKIALLEKHNVMEYNYEQQLTKNHEVSELQKDVILSNLTNAIKLKDEKAKLLQASLAASVAQCSELEMKKKFLIAENQNQYQRKESFLLTEEVKTLNIVIENLKAKMTDMSGKDVGLMNSCEKV